MDVNTQTKYCNTTSSVALLLLFLHRRPCLFTLNSCMMWWGFTEFCVWNQNACEWNQFMCRVLLLLCGWTPHKIRSNLLYLRFNRTPPGDFDRLGSNLVSLFIRNGWIKVIKTVSFLACWRWMTRPQSFTFCHETRNYLLHINTWWHQTFGDWSPSGSLQYPMGKWWHHLILGITVRSG